jgi:hypothetical protein
MGIIGSVLMFPALGCTFLCGSCLETSVEGSTGFFLVFGILPIVLGIVGGIKGKSNPNLSFILLLVAAVCCIVCLIITLGTNIIIYPALILYIVGAVIAKTQKMDF